MHPVAAMTMGSVLGCGASSVRKGLGRLRHHALRTALVGCVGGGMLGAGLGVGPGAAAPAGPLDLPPDGFGAMQYVDPAGCVYQRRSLEDPWQARLNRDQMPLCGYEPTFVGSGEEPDAPPAKVNTPAENTMPRLRLAAPAIGAILTQPGARALPPRIVSSQLISAQLTSCPVHVSMGPAVLVRSYQLSDGRAVLRCGPQSVDPVGFINQAGIKGLTVTGVDAGGQAMPATGRMMTALARALPLGLAPTAEGTRALITRARAPVAAQPGTRYVQVGAFAQLANVERIATTLAGMGLPVRIVTIKIRGKDADLISAGPFPAKDAPSVLRRVRAAGYRDAIMR